MTTHVHESPSIPALFATIEVMVSVYRVEEPEPLHKRGNTASGLYIVLFDKDVVHVQDSGIATRIVYRLSADTVESGIVFSGAFASDPRFQLSGPYLDCSTPHPGSADEPQPYDLLSYMHTNTHASLISLSLQFSDLRKGGRRVAYDPQITNTPGDN